MKRIISITAIFIVFNAPISILAGVQDYTITTQSYVTRKTNGTVADGASTEVTANTQFDVYCFQNQKELKGSIMVDINHVKNILDSEHSSFSQLSVPAIPNESGLYGFVESINGTQIKGMGPYLVICKLSVKDS